MVKLLSGRLLVTLDEGKNNIGRIVQHKCEGDPNLKIPREVVVVPPDEEPPPVLEQEWYDHVIFVKEMTSEVEIDGVTYVGMKADAIIAVITD